VLNKLKLVLFLFLMGLIGAAFPFLLNRDGMTLIILGFGFGVLQLHNKLLEDAIAPRYFNTIRIITTGVLLIAIASAAYTAYKYITNFNGVMLIGFIILQVWLTILVFKETKNIKK